MTGKLFPFLMFFILFLSGNVLLARDPDDPNEYHGISEIRTILENFQQSFPEKCRMHTLAVSPGGEPVTLLEIGTNQTGVPAVFVGANFEGNIPFATEGALRLAQMLLDSVDYTKGMKWYLLPQPNPDAAKGFFSDVRYNRTVNDFPVNNDGDEAVNEDGFDDLNGDGWITQMRVRCHDGTHTISRTDSRLMVRAKPSEGERGAYKIYTEGIDNDKDGLFNEDGEGGINPGIAFPHLFPENNKSAGLWPGQTPEVYGIMRFIIDHPEIAMVYTLGSSGFCLDPPQSNRKGTYDPNRIKLPSHHASRFGVDASVTYTMEEVIEMVKEHVSPGTMVNPAMVAGMLDLGERINPHEEDLKFYTGLSDECREYLKGRNFHFINLSPEPAKDGSFELWAYYHLGVPSFSMNLFSVPVKKEDEKNDRDEKKTDRKEKPFVRQDTKEKSLLSWSDSLWGGKGFVEWENYQHPDLGEVEIGGFVPGFETTPPSGRADELLDIQLPWLLKLSKKLPVLSFADEKLTPLGAGVYKLEIFIENEGYLSWPIAMGQQNRQPAPVVVVLDGNVEIMEGSKRTPLGSIGGNQVKKLTWLIRAEQKTEISARLESPLFGGKRNRIEIGG